MRIGPVGFSVLLHAGIAMAMVRSADERRDAPEVVEFAVVERKPPPPPPEPEPEPEPEPAPEPPPPPKARPRPATEVRKVQAEPRPLEPEAPPPPDIPAPAEPPPSTPPTGFALELDATVTTGAGISVAARAGGGNAYADPNRKDLSPGRGAEPPPTTTTPSPVLEVTRMPDCPRDLPIRYPPEARRLGEEAQIQVRAVIGVDGRVTEARVLKGRGLGFDEAALEAVKAMRCKPGMAGRDAIAVPITYKVDFFIEDW